MTTVDEGRPKRSGLGLVALAGLAWILAGGACHSGASPADVTMACHDYCDKYVAAHCATGFTIDIDTCRAQKCVEATGRSADCRDTLKTNYDCLQTQPDLCAEGACTREALAVILSCGTS